MPIRRPTVTTLINDPKLQPYLEHPATQGFGRKSGHEDSGGLLNALANLNKRHESVRFKDGDKVTTWSMADIFHLLYSYVINRTLAIMTIEADGYILRHFFDSMTDDAFFYFVLSLVSAETGLEQSRTRPGKTIVTIDGLEKASRAFKVIKDQPLKFTVQLKDDQQHLGAQQAALFWFNPSAQVAGGWDMSWDYMSKSYAVCFYNDENYEFAGGDSDT